MYYRHSWPNLTTPRDLSEIILAEILSGDTATYAPYCDKLRAREILSSWGYAHMLPELVNQWTSVPANISDLLKRDCVLKPSNSTGGATATNKILELPYERRYAAVNELFDRYSTPPDHEPQYASIPPHLLMERWVGNPDVSPVDYKFMTCGGVVHGALVCTERDTRTRLSFLNKQWEPLPWVKDEYLPSAVPPMPTQFQEMLDVAEDIASRFRQVRVDMYAPREGETYIGELTFTPQGGYMTYFTTEALDVMGSTLTQG
ncbi:ATP-grasp fold amidoligase family protein [Flexivirga lutea]